MTVINRLSGVFQPGVKFGATKPQSALTQTPADQFVRFGNNESSQAQPEAKAPDTHAVDIEVRIALAGARNDAELIAALNKAGNGGSINLVDKLQRYLRPENSDDVRASAIDAISSISLAGARNEKELITAINKAGDGASDLLVGKLQGYLKPDNSDDVRFYAADAIIGQANRGQAKAVDAYINLVNYGDPASTRDSAIRQLALRSFADAELQNVLIQSGKMDAYQQAVAKLTAGGDPMDLPALQLRELAAATLATPVQGHIGQQLMSNIYRKLTAPKAGTEFDIVEKRLVAALNGSEKAALGLIQDLNATPAHHFLPASFYKAKDVLPLLLEATLTQKWADSSFKTAIQGALEAGLAKSSMSHMTGAEGVQTIFNYLEPEALRNNLFRSMAAARLNGQSAYTGLEAGAAKYVKPLATENSDYYGLEKLENILNECTFTQSLGKDDLRKYEGEQEARLNRLTTPAEMSLALQRLEKSENGRFKELTTDFTQFSNPTDVQFMFGPGMFLPQQSAAYLKAQLLHKMAEVGHAESSEDFHRLFKSKELPMVKTRVMAPLKALQQTLQVTEQEALGASWLAQLASGEEKPALEAKAQELEVRARALAEAVHRAPKSLLNSNPWVKVPEATGTESANLEQSIQQYLTMMVVGADALSTLALKTDANGQYTNPDSIRLLGDLIAFEGPALENTQEALCRTERTRNMLLSVMQRLSPSPGRELFHVRAVALQTIAQIDFTKVPDGDRIKATIQQQLKGYFAKLGEHAFDAQPLMAFAGKLYSQFGLAEEEIPAFRAGQASMYSLEQPSGQAAP